MGMGNGGGFTLTLIQHPILTPARALTLSLACTLTLTLILTLILTHNLNLILTLYNPVDPSPHCSPNPCPA